MAMVCLIIVGVIPHTTGQQLPETAAETPRRILSILERTQESIQIEKDILEPLKV